MQTWKYLPTEKQAVAIGALCEGNSIRSVERMTGIHRDTVMRLGVRVGEACRNLLDETMRELPCAKIEMDEIWGFVGKKQRNVTEEDSAEVGDVWTWVAIDPESKAVPTFRIGKRDASDANAFVADLASRMKNRIQLSSDGLNSYPAAVEAAFGSEVDYGTIVKTFSTSEEGKYSPGQMMTAKRQSLIGENFRTCTSYVERQNLTMRLHMKRLARLTLAFSKKLDNFKAATALHFAYYNFVKQHGSLSKSTPAMALGVSSRLWKVEDLVALSQ
jgi:IS1 family transposase